MLDIGKLIQQPLELMILPRFSSMLDIGKLIPIHLVNMRLHAF